MPPVRKAGGTAFRKDVEFVAKNADEQIAAGIVMVPNAVDLQGDWERPDTVQGFAEQFENFYEVDESGNGVMHAVFPDEHASLERNEITGSGETIGETDVPEGAWVQEWQFEDEELWSLIDDGILEGYSIGADAVRWDGPMDQDDLPEGVSVPEEIDEDEPVWELTEGIVREVSTVDIPAVPDALIYETKANADKRLADHLGNRDGFIEEALERGHNESEAERLWDYLNRAADMEGSGEPGKQSFFERIGKAAVNAFTGSDDGNTQSEALDNADKAGQTINTANRGELKAVMDAADSIFQDAGYDTGFTRFTDREDDSFDLSEHSAREFDIDEEEEEEEDVSPFNNATESDTSDTNDTQHDMTDDNDNPMADAPEWGKALYEKAETNSERIDEVLENNENTDDPLEDAPEWAKQLHEQSEQNAERIDAISEQAGTVESQQLGGAANGNGENGLSDREAFFVPESKQKRLAAQRRAVQ